MPANSPAEVSVTPAGRLPAVNVKVTVEGVPVAVTLNDSLVPMVNVVLVALENVGATGVEVGVTMAVADGALVPKALIAFTLQVYVVPFVSPVTRIGDTVLVLLPLGKHVAL